MELDELNELTKSVSELMEKMNLNLELTGAQIQNAVMEMGQKIITWKFTTSTICLAISLMVLTLTLVYCKRKHFIANLKESVNEVFIEKTSEGTYYLTLLKIIGISTLSFILIVNIIDSIYNMVLCSVFPEKIILEFISSYF